jgi:hypothetical protein
MRLRYAILLLPLLALAVTQTPPPLVTLVNPDFEAGFSVRESQEVEVAIGWDYSYLTGDDRWCRAPCYRPEWKPEQQIAVAGHAQRWFSTFSRHYAAIHQSVQVEADQWYRFACQVYAISEPDGQLAVRVGANPWNAGVLDHTMLWGQQQPWGQYRKWHEASVTFQAWSNTVRVAVGSVPNYPTKNNAAYVDNCTLTLVEPGQCPECPVCPTPTPCPDCPPCNGGGCDYERIRTIVRDELTNRNPVVWPK